MQGWTFGAGGSQCRKLAGGPPLRSHRPLSSIRPAVLASARGQRQPAEVGADPARRQHSPKHSAARQPQRNEQSNIVAKPRLQRKNVEIRIAPQTQQQLREVQVSDAPVSSSDAAGAACPPFNSRSRFRGSFVVTSWPTPELDGAHRPVGMVVGSAWLLSVAVQLTGAAALTPLWLPVVAGGMVGAVASAAHRHGVRRLWRAPKAPLRVLITGGSSGVGKALAREFLRCGDSVVVTSRSMAGAQQAAAQLREEVGPHANIMGLECNVGDPTSVDALMDGAVALLGGHIDVVINNAGFSGSFQSFLSQSPEQVRRVVETNLLGSLLVTRAAMRHMATQPNGGHIFNTEGAGSDGSATPQYAAYGATKCAIAQLLRTLQYEAAALPNPVRVHNMSPGMVLTPLLLDGATTQSKQVFNILCEHPETVAAFLVPRARTVVARGRRGAAIRYLTPARALAKFLTAPLHAGKYFDREGRPLYAPERERLLGAAQAKRTQRRQRAAARRSVPLQLAYSLGMALSFLLIVSDALAKAPGQ